MMTRRNIFTENNFSDHVKNAIEMIGNDLEMIWQSFSVSGQIQTRVRPNVGQMLDKDSVT